MNLYVKSNDRFSHEITHTYPFNGETIETFLVRPVDANETVNVNDLYVIVDRETDYVQIPNAADLEFDPETKPVYFMPVMR